MKRMCLVTVFLAAHVGAQPTDAPKPPSAEPPKPAADAAVDGPSSIVASGVRAQRICTGHRFTEGPVWITDAGAPGGGFLLFSDIPANTIFKWTPAADGTLAESKATAWLSPSGHSNGLTLDTKGNVLIAQHAGAVARREKLGEPTILADKFDGKPLNSPNDLCVRSDGLIYFTDPPYGLGRLGPGGRERGLDFCGVYLLTPDGTVSVQVKDMPTPNGIALSPDEKTIYVADTSRGNVRAYAVNPDGTFGAGRPFAELKFAEGPRAGKSAGADGIRVDEQGHVYVAASGGAWVYDAGGKHLGVIRIEGSATNLCFGGPDRKTLFITGGSSVWAVRTLIAGLPTPRPAPKTTKDN